jgi:hypothetical protein
MIFLTLCHIATCLWICAASALKVQDHGNMFTGTWLEPYYDIYGENESAIYAISLYWTITTITTVGYGDISATNLFEMAFASIMMLIGVVSFSFANGTLASIMTNQDNASANYN